MTINICPNCNQRYVVSPNICDYVHDCFGNATKTEEDIVITGNWEDDSGRGIVPAQQVLMQGVENELQGTRADIDGKDKEDTTRHGNRKSTHRTRPYKQFINLSEEKLD